MKEEIKIVIVDADGLIALINTDDANHEKAKEISTILTEQNVTIQTPITAFIEAITALKRGVKRPDLAKEIVSMYKNGKIPVTDVPTDIILLAITYFNPKDSKQNTFFDAVIAAIAKKEKAQAIFSFDKWYNKQGFKLAQDLLS